MPTSFPVRAETDELCLAYSGAMDLALSILPWKLLWSLQMQKKEKIGVIIAMSMGLVYVRSPPALISCLPTSHRQGRHNRLRQVLQAHDHALVGHV